MTLAEIQVAIVYAVCELLYMEDLVVDLGKIEYADKLLHLQDASDKQENLTIVLHGLKERLNLCPSSRSKEEEYLQDIAADLYELRKTIQTYLSSFIKRIEKIANAEVKKNKIDLNESLLVIKQCLIDPDVSELQKRDLAKRWLNLHACKDSLMNMYQKTIKNYNHEINIVFDNTLNLVKIMTDISGDYACELLDLKNNIIRKFEASLSLLPDCNYVAYVTNTVSTVGYGFHSLWMAPSGKYNASDIEKAIHNIKYYMRFLCAPLTDEDFQAWASKNKKHFSTLSDRLKKCFFTDADLEEFWIALVGDPDKNSPGVVDKNEGFLRVYLHNSRHHGLIAFMNNQENIDLLEEWSQCYFSENDSVLSFKYTSSYS